MNLEGRKIIVNKSTKDLFEMLKNPQDYKYLMPDSLISFEYTADGFKFALKGMPEVSLKISEFIENEKIEIQKVLSKPDKEYQEYRERLQKWEEKEKEII